MPLTGLALIRARAPERGQPMRVPPYPLSDQHLLLLQLGSTIDLDVITERGYYTACHFSELRGLGFRQSQLKVECFPALVIPQYDPSGEYSYSIVRWDVPRIGAKGKEIKYDQPAGVGLRLDVPPRCLPGLWESDRPVWWTEGSKKADALASRGLIAVSTPGVDGWRSPSSIVDLFGLPLKERLVYCAYDSDVLTKPAVHRAVTMLARWLGQKGAHVRVVDWRQVLGGAAEATAAEATAAEATAAEATASAAEVAP